MRKIFTFLFAALMSVGMWAEPITVTWNSSTFSSIDLHDGQSFTQDGVTVTVLDGRINGRQGDWMGFSNDASFKFSTSLGNFTKIEITGNINDLGGSGWTQTSPGAVWTGEANETTFGKYFENVSQIVFTIAEPETAATEVTITQADFPTGGESITKDGVTVSAGWIDGSAGEIYGEGSFSTTLGNFTKIEVYAGVVTTPLGEGWSGNSERQTWTGNASSVSFSGNIMSEGEEVNLMFTIEPASTPEPTEVTVVFAANNKTVERTVTLPHTFKCDWNNGMDGPEELDIIIHELYNDYYYCNSNMNASGSDQVEVGTEEAPQNDYITIKGVFEGTVTVTGDYFDWITGEEGAHNYSITISIKGDESGATAVENVQTNQVQATKFFRNGMLLIEKNGKIYNVMGAQVK